MFANHPAADLFPMMTGDEMAALVEDVRENGLLEPIVLLDGMVLDGRNRMAACEAAGVSVRVVHWDGQGGSPVRFVRSHNLNRRHLTTSQRAAIAVEMIPMLQEEAHQRQLAGLKRGAVPVSADRRQREKAAEEAAELMGVGARTVQRAKEVKAASPEEFNKVKAGEKSVEAAHKDAGLGGSGKVHQRATDAEQTPPLEVVTKRDHQRAEAAKTRLVTVLSGISGFCRGLQEIDLRRAVAKCTAEEIATWAAIAAESARTLKALRSTLNDMGTHE